MKKHIIAAALLVLGAPAFAGSYWISPTGHYGRSPVYTGYNSGAAALSSAWANDSLVAGDTCLVSAGTYPTALAPRHTGTPSQYIVWVGNVSDPYAAVFSSINIDSTLGATRCISVKGVGTSGDLTFKTDSSYAAGYDSVSYCTVKGQFNLNGRDNVSVHHCTIGDGGSTDKLAINNNMPTGVTAWNANNPLVHQKNYDRYRSIFVDSLYIADNVFDLGTTSGSAAMQLRGVQKSQILRNRFTLRGIGTTNAHLQMWFDCSYNTVNDNKWTGTANSASTLTAPYYLLNLRDNHVRNSWSRDTLVEDSGSAKTLKVMFATAGNNRDYGELPDSARTFDFGDSNNTFSECYVRVRGPIGTQSRADNNKFVFNTWVTDDHVELSPISTSSPDSNQTDSLIFRHNTIFATAASAINNESKLNHSIFTQNIIVSATPSTYAGHFGFGKGSSFTKCDSNLVWCWTATDSMLAVGLGFLGGPATKVGSNSTWGRPPLSYDTVSKWGDPQFADSTTSDFTFDPRPNPASIAYSADWADGYVGAIATPADVTAPVVTITGPTGLRYWSVGETFPLTWSATDAVGVTSFAVQWAGGKTPIAWDSVTSGLASTTTSLDWTLPALSQSYSTVRVLAYDAAGNVGTATLTFRCDVPSDDGDTDPYRFPE